MLKVAIIGSGMAGLTAARIMKDAGHEVYVFEALTGKGMDSHSLTIDGGIIDSPLRVMNPLVWENTINLAKSVGVDFFQVNTFMSCNWLNHENNTLHRGATWLSTGRTKYFKLPTITDRNFIQQYSSRLLKGFFQFQNALQKFASLSEETQQNMTLAQFMNRYPCEPFFWHGCVMPVLYTLCTCNAKDLGNWTAKPLLEFMKKMHRDEPLLRMYGGTHGFVNALSEGIKFFSNSKVTKIEIQNDDSILVMNTDQIRVIVDKVIVATPTHVIDFLDENSFKEELELLRKYKFVEGELVIHTDTQCMPKHQKHWSALSYMMDKNFGHQMFTVWLNAVEPSLKGKQNTFQTWNPTINIHASKIIDQVRLSRAIVDTDTISNTKKLREIQKNKDRKVYFCGSWMNEGLPILESAVTSAMFVTEQLGVKANFTASAHHEIQAIKV